MNNTNYYTFYVNTLYFLWQYKYTSIFWRDITTYSKWHLLSICKQNKKLNVIPLVWISYTTVEVCKFSQPLN